MKESSGGSNSSMIDLIHCKNFCKYSSVPPPSTTIIKNKTVNKVVFPDYYGIALCINVSKLYN
jgi:hypothetical protein